MTSRGRQPARSLDARYSKSSLFTMTGLKLVSDRATAVEENKYAVSDDGGANGVNSGDSQGVR